MPGGKEAERVWIWLEEGRGKGQEVVKREQSWTLKKIMAR